MDLTEPMVCSNNFLWFAIESQTGSKISSSQVGLPGKCESERC